MFLGVRPPERAVCLQETQQIPLKMGTIVNPIIDLGLELADRQFHRSQF